MTIVIFLKRRLDFICYNKQMFVTIKDVGNRQHDIIPNSSAMEKSLKN